MINFTIMSIKRKPQEGRVNMRLMAELKAKGKKRANEKGVSFAELIRQLLKAELSN